MRRFPDAEHEAKENKDVPKERNSSRKAMALCPPLLEESRSPAALLQKRLQAVGLRVHGCLELFSKRGLERSDLLGD